jgi:NifU-like protein involved in Fe-S cluster formation
MTIYDYFERACRRSLEPVAGEPARDDEGNCAIFSVAVTAGRITTANYRCTTCTTLVALCEHLSELVIGLNPPAALTMKPETLLVLHPEIPEAKRATAALALKALQSAIRQTEPRP